MTGSKTAGEAGWRLSRYNLACALPGTDRIGIANLFRGVFGTYSPGEAWLLSCVESLPEDHPVLERFRARGLIVDFDERAALFGMGRSFRAGTDAVTLTLCTTMRCNFDCPYCFEMHSGVDMSPEVQDASVALAGRMLRRFRAKHLSVIWFGGEPLLRPDTIQTMTARLRALAQELGADYTAQIFTNGYLLTQKIVDMLAACAISRCVIALDGVGAAHDRTRHLAGGGGTFDTITENLRTLRFPFPIQIRHLLTGDNLDQAAPLEAYTKHLARESGNVLFYAPDTCGWNNASDDRCSGVRYLAGGDAADVGARRDAGRFISARGGYCGACSLSSVSIDARGMLYKCWPEMDNRDGRAFGSVFDWDPADPLVSASAPEQLARYLDTAVSDADPECRDCVWLPYCAGGCPYYRVNVGKDCLPYRDAPEKLLLALYARLQRQTAAREHADAGD